jgi:hypothetical protein
MRVIECRLCGEVLGADNDEQLRGVVERHVAAEHSDAGLGEEQVRELVERDAYTATDA